MKKQDAIKILYAFLDQRRKQAEQEDWQPDDLLLKALETILDEVSK